MAVQDLEALGSDCNAACKQVRADLQGEEKEVFETKLAFLKAVLESMEPVRPRPTRPRARPLLHVQRGPSVATRPDVTDAASRALAHSQDRSSAGLGKTVATSMPRRLILRVDNLAILGRDVAAAV
ncbi:hypothetical protein CYMTET_33043 [Cymbomonas tetramitiformis]|uniref:Uncharacterized protein n=1 Tax=Cymbomonas tetramitiformis TaxID=36881 RepID=A0AAE0KRL6_9CHLO|nr:hypothetical protein CYMTET_33043 [Cymbomonas tetramitiformis]